MVDQYLPGACNIGPAEIARRRRAGHVGLILTVVLAAVLLALDAAPAWRLTLALPAALAAAGYLQAWLRFCANFGFRGVYNFDALGREERVAELRLETVYPVEREAEVVRALRAAHPYEEPAFDLYALVDPSA